MVFLFLCSFVSGSRGPLKGALSAEKVLPLSKTKLRELLEGLKVNKVLPDEGVMYLISRQINDLFLTNESPRILTSNYVSPHD